METLRVREELDTVFVFEAVYMNLPGIIVTWPNCVSTCKRASAFAKSTALSV